jgi:geranylgeranyl diphosphate synthase, type II
MQTESAHSQSTFDFATYLAEKRVLIERELDAYLISKEPKMLWESIRYSVLEGGKRLRAILCLTTGLAVIQEKLSTDEVVQTVLPCACAIEMIHAMSLIHDDLPALDNDDLRRGKPTNHKVYGEAIALLAGDALLMLACETLLTKTPKLISMDSIATVTNELCRATGAEGMVGGQVYDLEFTGRVEQLRTEGGIASDTSTLELIHRGKTGALIKFSAWSGAKLIGASDKELGQINKFSEVLGLAFQIADDLLDVTGDVKSLGKTPGKDQAANKVTWVTLFGEEETRSRLKHLEAEGLELLDNLDCASEPATALRRLLQYAIHRSN